MMLTPAGPGALRQLYRSHSLVGELRNAACTRFGYRTRVGGGAYDSFSTSLAREADEQIFLNDWSWKDTQLDGKIVDELDARGGLS